MKKTMLWLVLTLLVMLLIPMTAGAVTTVNSGYSFYIGEGESVMPDYPDLAYLIGEGLTKNDFVITYSSSLEFPNRHFDADGRCTIGSFSTPYNMPFYMTYTPKVQGVGEKTIFKGFVMIREPLTEISISATEIILATDETAQISFRHERNTASGFRLTDYDNNIIDASLEQASWNEYVWYINITPKTVGETDIIVQAYNGLQKTVHVAVKDPPSKLSFAQDAFTCFVGDTVDLGMDLGGGGMLTDPSVKVTMNGYNQSAEAYFPKDWEHFYAKEEGEYVIKMKTYNGHEATVKVNVYSWENCVRLGLPYTVVNVGESYVDIWAYDAAGNKVTQPLAITKGADIASIVNRTLVTTGTGIVEITATNPDGSTVTLTVEVAERPTQVFLNATDLTLNIGDTFDFEVSFDKGNSDYKLSISYDDYSPAYQLYPVRLEGDRIIAQAPGTLKVSVRAGYMDVSCNVTVLDGDAVVHVNTPPDLFAIGDSFQLSVADKAGKTYPATYSYAYEYSDPALTLTQDGLITGVRAGTVRIIAALADGRKLTFDQTVERVPTWISHPDLVVKEDYTTTGLEPIETDMGLIYSVDVMVSVEDPTVATYDNPFFEFHKVGSTKVTLTAKKGGAQTTFLLTVLPADNLYILADGELYGNAYYRIDVASGYTITLPQVVDYYRNPVSVTWKMTYHVPGSGNPTSTGFKLSGNKLSCTWSSAYCQLTATAKDGRTIRMAADGYRLAQKIRFENDTYTIRVGETAQTEVTIVEMGYGLGPITWTVADESIVSFDAEYPQTGRPTVTGLRPGTTKLTAKLMNGVKATCTIVVEEPYVPPRTPGDANSDGIVDIQDGVRVLQYDVGWNVSIDLSNADVNADGAVDMTDAVLILQYDAGWNVELK